VTADKFQGAILVVQFEGADAVVWSDQGLILVRLSDLATAWTGGYTFFWQVPKGWQGPIAPGESGLAVSTIAEMFATLDGMTLGDVSVYGPALEARVRLFQQSEGLDVDGVIGERTVLRLNTRLGIGLTSARALSRAQLWAESR
jgi:general secretion pathway protein A